MSGGYQRVGVNTNVKQFNTSAGCGALWVFNKPSKTITPTIKGANVLIPGDLTVVGSIYNPSDMNIKENIEILTDADIEFVSQLKPVKYNYIHDSAKKPHFGLIAQEVSAVAPNLVGEIQDGNISNDSIKAINYIEIIPILLAKINMMQGEINELKECRVKDKLEINETLRNYFYEWNCEWSKQINRQQVNLNNMNTNLSKLKRKTDKINNI